MSDCERCPPEPVRELVVHADGRGDVRETFRESWLGQPVKQMVRSFSRVGTIRGMHLHKRQTDVWTFVEGRALVQLLNPATGWHKIHRVDARQTLVIPPGIAHGFQALTDCILVYGLTEEYDGSDEYGFNPFSEDFLGRWQWAPPPGGDGGEWIVSERDRKAPSLRQLAAEL
jgi:dTDP-4-dehydrorhamnose 3,5-epimerase